MPDRQLVDLRPRVLRRRELPAKYHGALFFADYSRNCIWVMRRARTACPDDATSVSTFDAGASGPVDIQIGPGGDLFYAAFDERHDPSASALTSNQPRSPRDREPTSGPTPLHGQLRRAPGPPTPRAPTSRTPGISTATAPSTTRPRRSRASRTPQTRTYTVQLRVTDPQGASRHGRRRRDHAGTTRRRRRRSPRRPRRRPGRSAT